MVTLVTGGAGFVGLAVTEALLAAGEAVVALDAAPLPDAARAVFGRLPGTLRTVQADVRDAAAVAAAMAGARRVVIGAAVTCGPDRELAAPEEVAAVNVGAVATAVRLAAQAGVQRVVHLSSVAVYGAGPQTEAGLLAEEMACRPRGLYGITKLAGEATALRLAELAGLDLVAARLGSCFGPWEHATGKRDTLSPQLQVLMALRRGEPVVLDRDAVRDWLYVRDAAAAILALLGAERLHHRVFNVGSGAVSALSAWCEALQPGLACRVGAAATVQSWGDRPSLDIARLLAGTPFRARFGVMEAAQDWQSFLGMAGEASLRPREPAAIEP